MRFIKAAAILMLMAIVSMGTVSAIGTSFQAYPKNYGYDNPVGADSGTYIDNRQFVNIVTFGDNNDNIVGQQQFGAAEKKEEVRGSITARIPEESAAYEPEDDCFEMDCGTITPNEIDAGVRYDYVCKQEAPIFLNLMKGFFWVKTEDMALTVEPVYIGTIAKLEDQIANIDASGISDATEKADMLMEVTNNPVIVTSNNKVYVYAVAYHDGLTVELFKVVTRDGGFELVSEGWAKIDGSSATDNTPATTGGDYIKANGVILWGPEAMEQWQKMGFA